MLPSLRRRRSVVHDGSTNNRARILSAIGFSLLVILAVLFVGTGANNALSPNGSHDFQWTPAKDLIDGINPYRDFMQWREQGNTSVPPHFLNQSPSYPASTYVMLSPFAHLDWDLAKRAWLITNLALIGLLVLGMQKTFPVKKPAILALLALAFLIASPLRTSLGAGQHNFLSLAAFIWAYYFVQNGRNTTLSGVLLAVAWVKYSLTFPLTLIFLRRGSIKPVLIASAIHAFLTCIAAWRIGMWPHEFFFSSVSVVLMGDGTGFLNLIALCMNLNLPLHVPLIAISIATVSVTVALLHYRDTDTLKVLAFLGLFSCAVFYHHGYDFVVLLFCAWALAQNKLHGATAASTAFLLGMAWVGHWFVSELSPLLGIQLTTAADYLLISVFYCTLFLMARSIYTNHTASKVAAIAY